MGCLYMLTFPNDKKYVGITTRDIEWRFKQHVSASVRNKTYLAKAIKKYGADTIKKRVLVIANDADYLKDLEIKAIVAFNSKWPNGYNNTIGGDGVHGAASETEINRRKKLSRTHKTPSAMKKNLEIQKQYWTEERKAQRAESIKQKWADPEYRAMILSARQKPLQMGFAFSKNKTDVKRRLRAKHWDNPDFREGARQRNLARLSNPDELKKLSENQKRVMADPEMRLQIAHSLSKFKNRVFVKSGAPVLSKYDRGGLLQSSIPLLPNPFSAIDAIRRGWLGREFERAIDRGWIKQVNCENF
jgi:hypothetical protein